MMRALVTLLALVSAGYGGYLILFAMHVPPNDWSSVATGLLGAVMFIGGVGALLNTIKA